MAAGCSHISSPGEAKKAHGSIGKLRVFRRAQGNPRTPKRAIFHGADGHIRCAMAIKVSCVHWCGCHVLWCGFSIVFPNFLSPFCFIFQSCQKRGLKTQITAEKSQVRIWTELPLLKPIIWNIVVIIFLASVLLKVLKKTSLVKLPSLLDRQVTMARGDGRRMRAHDVDRKTLSCDPSKNPAPESLTPE